MVENQYAKDKSSSSGQEPSITLEHGLFVFIFPLPSTVPAHRDV